MADTSFLPSTITRDARLAEYTDRLVRHVGEQAGSVHAELTENVVNLICDTIGEGQDATGQIGRLTTTLTSVLGSTHMITEGVDDLLDLIIETAAEKEDDETRSASYDPYGLDSNDREMMRRFYVGD